MIRRIIRFSAHNRLLVLLATAVAVAYGVYTLRHIPVDAIPDLSDTQVIVYSRWDRSPDIMEDQVTYPIVTALLGAPNVKAIRGFSDFGFSYVYVIFKDGTDLYWARSRVLEYLSKIQPLLPAGRAAPSWGPTPPAWAGSSSTRWWTTRARHSLGRPAHLPGLEPALPAPVGARRGRGGLHRRLRAAVPGHGRPQPAQGLRPRHHGRGGRRARQQRRGGRAAARVLGPRVHGARPRLRAGPRPTSSRSCSRPTSAARPCCCATSASVALGPEIRRGVSDLDGRGDAVGGIVVMRHGENARDGDRAREGAPARRSSPRCPRACASSPPTTARS